MSINTLLTELVVLADLIDAQGLSDITADLDAAIFIFSSEDAQPLNKSVASLAREQYATIVDEEISDEAIETAAMAAVQDIMQLAERMLDLEPKLMLAALQGVTQGMKSLLAPGTTLATQSVTEGTELLAEAERKLAVDGKQKSVGYRLGVLRSKLEQNNG